MTRPAEAEAAIVFIHGLGGDCYDTWGPAGSPATFLGRAASDLPHAAVATFGYTSGRRRALDPARIPVMDLARIWAHTLRDSILKAFGTAAIVCHSLGGVITMAALRHLLTTEPEWARRLREGELRLVLVLMGVPQEGTDTHRTGWLSDELRALTYNNQLVRANMDFWRSRVRQPEGAAGSGTVPIAICAVVSEADGWVPQLSAVGNLAEGDCRRVALAHDEIVKPPTEGSFAPYDFVLARIRQRVGTDGGAKGSYLSYLRRRYRYLNLKGIDVTSRVAFDLPLTDLYVPLKARTEVPEADTWDREPMVAGRRLFETEVESVDQWLTQPRSLIELVQESVGLVILGDPGSGKTTFLKYLAVGLATGRGEELGLSGYLPVLVPLTAYARALTRDGPDLRLDAFVGRDVHRRGGPNSFETVLKRSLRDGRCLFLLDGLDEIQDAAERDRMVERLEHFLAFHWDSGNKFVLTSRIVGYKEVRAAAQNFSECTLVDLDDEDIEAFVNLWAVAIPQRTARAAEGPDGRGGQGDAGLLAVIRQNPAVRRLSANPLLLTILALMSRGSLCLPDQRVELYGRYVEALVSSWNKARGLASTSDLSLDWSDTSKILSELALWMRDSDPVFGLVKRHALERRLESIFSKRNEADPSSCARRFLSDVREHAGVLVERGANRFGFMHLSFEEYLSAREVALRADDDGESAARWLAEHAEDRRWDEVALLMIAYFAVVNEQEEVAGSLLESLVAEQPTPSHGGIILAGRALVEVQDRISDRRSRQVILALLRTMQHDDVEPRTRRTAGLLLGQLGWQPPDLDEVVLVSPPPAAEREERDGAAIHRPYWVSKYPVTNVQFQKFLDSAGYDNQAFWSREGWQWRSRLGRRTPRALEEDFAAPLLPRVRLTRFEADAYCRWAGTSQTLRGPGGTRRWQPPPGYRAQLLTLGQWVWAARGGDDREYPWGSRQEPFPANTVECQPSGRAGIGTTPVCMYPQGESPFGVVDLSGNALEWTATAVAGVFNYVCGGCFEYARTAARCTSRLSRPREHSDSNLGFRVAVTPA